MELNMGIIAEVVMVEVRLVLLKSSLNGLVRGAVMGVQVNIQGGVVPVLMVRGEGVVREGEVIINEEGIMRRHHNTPELGGEDGGHWGRGWWRLLPQDNQHDPRPAAAALCRPLRRVPVHH